MNGLRRMAPFLRSYRAVFFWLVVTAVLPVAMELAVPRALRHVIDEGIEAGDMGAITRGAGVMLAAALVGVAATLGQGVCRALLSQGLAYDLRDRLFTHVQTFSFANLDQMQTGQLMTRISSDVDLVRMFLSNGLALIMRAVLMIAGSVVLMALIDRRLTLIILALLPIAAVLIAVLMRLAQPMFARVQEELSALNTTVQENLAGVAVVRAFVREAHELGLFARVNTSYRDKNIRVGRLLSVVLPLILILTNLGMVAIAWFGGLDTIRGRLTVGELVAFNSYLMIGMAPLALLTNMLTLVSRAEASARRVWEVLDTVPALADPPRAYRPERVRGEVALDLVTFRYDGGREAENGVGPAPRSGGANVLEGVSLRARPGERVALLGATGAGKSTLVSLIPRFYDVDGGRVLVDGVDVRAWDRQALRRGIGVVMQQTTLFSGTVRENITFGRPQATPAEVEAAARMAQAHDFIMAMPDGYESVVEERGANLSGGQKQRLAIARALLIDPGILILDDSTSAVDLETEARIQDALESLTRRCTTFIVAQRVSSVLEADQIIILEHGRVAARGTHRELLAGSPIYREIVASQLGQDGVPAGAEEA